MLVVVPPGVVRVRRPEVPPDGTVAARLVVVAALTTVGVAKRLNLILLFAGARSKLVPVMLTDAPGSPVFGVKLVMVGSSAFAVTVNGVALAAEPAGAVTLIDPVVAADGTVATICVPVAETTVAAVPLNVTVFWLGVLLKLVP